MWSKLLLVSCLFFVFIEDIISAQLGDVDLTSNINTTSTEDRPPLANADEIIVWMKRNSKKYLEEIGDKWIVGEKFNKRQISCLLDQGKCTKEMETIRDTLISALNNDCSTCSDTNKRLAGDALLVLLSRQPDVWRGMMKTFREQTIRTHELKDWL